MRLSKQALAAAAAREDWKLLWEQALPVVKFTIKRMIQRGDLDPFYAREDLLQEGNLAAGRAVRTWKPAQGAFSTWLYVKIRGDLINYLQTQSNHGMGSRRVRSRTVQLEEKHARLHGPCIDDALDETQRKEILQSRLARLPKHLARVMGLILKGKTEMQIAVRLCLDRSTVQRHIVLAKKKMTLFP